MFTVKLPDVADSHLAISAAGASKPSHRPQRRSIEADLRILGVRQDALGQRAGRGVVAGAIGLQRIGHFGGPLQTAVGAAGAHGREGGSDGCKEQ